MPSQYEIPNLRLRIETIEGVAPPPTQTPDLTTITNTLNAHAAALAAHAQALADHEFRLTTLEDAPPTVADATVVSSSKNAGSSTTPSVALPATAAIGDWLVVIVNHNDGTVTTSDNNGATPCVKQDEVQIPGGAGEAGFGVFLRKITGTEQSTLNFTLSASQRWVAMAWLIRGLGTGDFEIVPVVGVNEVDVDTVTCPGITTTTDHTIVFAVAGIDSTSSGTFTGVPATWTEIQTENTQQPTSAAYKMISPAGATGNAVFTKTSAGNNDTYSLGVFALTPVVAGGEGSWVGIYYATLTAMEPLVQRGVTRFQVWGSTAVVTAYCNEAVRLSGVYGTPVRIWVELADAFTAGPPTGYNSAALVSQVNNAKNHEGCEGFKSCDEPDLKGYSAATLITAYNDIKALTSKPVAMVIRYPWKTSSPNGQQYLPATDVIMPDPYIIPYGPATQVGDETALAVAAAGGKPVRTVIQATNWGNTFAPPPGRLPTVAEMYTMGETAREAGADHLWIWSWHDGALHGSANLDTFNPDFYAAMADVVAAWKAAG